MPILHAVVLGVVQALSEFLPISSSGHLRLTRWLLGWDELPPESSQVFDVAVHVGTLAGAIAYLRHDVVSYARGALAPLVTRAELGADGRIGWALLASAAPAAVAGVAFGDELAGSDRIWAIAVALIVFGVLLGLSDRCPERRGVEDFGMGRALIMGAAQALALQPGVSRSGVTITAARTLGFDRNASVRLAFLMSLPVIAGAGVYGTFGLEVPSSMWPALAWGAAVSAVIGWAAVWATIAVVNRLGLKPFVIYRITAGAAVLTALSTSAT